jgi:Putative auto-transporter adhesin, head GIN domain
MKQIFVVLVSVLLVFSSCSNFMGKRVRGNGKIVTETRAAGSFTGVRVSGAIDLYVSSDSVSAIRVDGDENLLKYVEVELDGSMLRIHTKRGVNLKPTRSIRVYVSAAEFSRLEASGACDIFTENKITSTGTLNVDLSGASDAKLEVNAPAVKVGVSGAGSVTLKGETRDFSVDGSGSTDIKCYELLAENTKVDISGAGNAEVFASVKLDVDVSGAADVKYKGNATVSQRVSGAGSVKKTD